MEAIKLCRLDTPIIFIEARINLSRFVVTGCAAKTSATVTFPSLNLISLFALCVNIWLNGFFFQAKDGIRVTSVTGVQTCALPISPGTLGPTRAGYLGGRRRLSPARLPQPGPGRTEDRAPGRARASTCPSGCPSGLSGDERSLEGAHRCLLPGFGVIPATEVEHPVRQQQTQLVGGGPADVAG